MTPILIVLLLVALIIVNVPIGYALMVSGAVGILVTHAAPLTIVPITLQNGSEEFTLLAIPLFMLMGELMNRGGLTDDLVELASSLVGFIRGGLAMVTIVSCMFLAEISGSAVADAAALGSVLIPSMAERGYPKPFAAAVTSVAATTAIIIPPSIPLIIYGALAQVSIGKLFIGTIVPGVLTGLTLMLVTYVMALRHKFAVATLWNTRRLARAFVRGLPVLAIPVIVLGGIMGGVFTPTESAAVSVLVAILLVLRRRGWRELVPGLSVAVSRTAAVMVIVAGSLLLGWYFAFEQVPQNLATALLSVTHNHALILALLDLFFLFIGTILHSTAAMIITVPVVAPIIKAVGINPLYFGIVLALNLGIGQQTPPVASVLLTTASIANVKIERITRAVLPFLVAMLAVLVLVTYVPALSLWLPSLFKSTA